MKTKNKKRILLLFSCLLMQSKGEFSCKKGFKGKENSVPLDDMTNETCAPNS